MHWLRKYFKIITPSVFNYKKILIFKVYSINNDMDNIHH